MRIYDRLCFADEGKQFTITDKCKAECPAWTNFAEPSKETSLWAIENGYVMETDIPGFVFGLDGFVVGYYHKNGTFLSCGNYQVFPTRKAAEKYARHYASYDWFDEEIVIREAKYNGIPLNESKKLNGKEIVDSEHYFGLDAHDVGEYFSESLVMELMDMLPPTTFRSDCCQIGEPYSHVNGKATYATFKKIADGVYEYCGHCFKGENKYATL